MPVRVTLLYFGQARDSAGMGEERFTLPEGSSVHALIKEAMGKHPRLLKMRDTAQLAVNEEIAKGDTALEDGDVVAILPPVAGG